MTRRDRRHHAAPQRCDHPFGPYSAGFGAALVRLRAGDGDGSTDPDRSYHDVWMRLHEPALDPGPSWHPRRRRSTNGRRLDRGSREDGRVDDDGDGGLADVTTTPASRRLARLLEAAARSPDDRRADSVWCVDTDRGQSVSARLGPHDSRGCLAPGQPCRILRTSGADPALRGRFRRRRDKMRQALIRMGRVRAHRAMETYEPMTEFTALVEARPGLAGPELFARTSGPSTWSATPVWQSWSGRTTSAATSSTLHSGSDRWSFMDHQQDLCPHRWRAPGQLTGRIRHLGSSPALSAR